MSELFRKERRGAPPGFFAAEAAGLRWLAEVPHGPPVPEVLDVGEEHIAMTRVETGAPTVAAAEEFGRALAVLHRAGAPSYGWDRPGYIGDLPLDNTTATSWPEWYAERRVLPYLRKAADRGAMSNDQVRAVEQACARIPALGLSVAERVARIHGDLWSGNILWSSEAGGVHRRSAQGQRVWLVDPAAHGGHRETDLAMLALFGAPHLDRILAAYDEMWPLADGWRDRVPLHQLHPLLVHAALFGGGYGAQAARAAEAVG